MDNSDATVQRAADLAMVKGLIRAFDDWAVRQLLWENVPQASAEPGVWQEIAKVTTLYVALISRLRDFLPLAQSYRVDTPILRGFTYTDGKDWQGEKGRASMRAELIAVQGAVLAEQRGPVQVQAPIDRVGVLDSDNEGVPKEDRGIALLAQHRDWSNKTIAGKLGVHPKTLSTHWPRFKAARKAIRVGRTVRPPRGSKDSNGTVEAWKE